MASLTLKNLPDELLRDLRRAAEKDRRSMTQQIVHLLEVALGRSKAAPKRDPRVEAQLTAWRKLAGRWESDDAPDVESRKIMNRRSGGREVDV